jgi:hypothetical protein
MLDKSSIDKKPRSHSETRGYVSKRCSLLVFKDGMKKRLLWFSCYLLKLIEKDTLYVRIVNVKLNGKNKRDKEQVKKIWIPDQVRDDNKAAKITKGMRE